MSFIDRTSDFVEKKVAPPLIRISENKYVDAIQKTFLAFMPILIIGSFFILLAALPIPAWTRLIGPIMGPLWGAVNSTFGLIAIGISAGMGFHLGTYYNKQDSEVEPFSTVLVVLFSFLILFPLAEHEDIGLYMTANNLGSTGIFVAIISAIITVEIYRVLINKRITIKMPEGVPPMVAGAFTALIPGFVAIAFWWIIRQVFNIDIPNLIMGVFEPLVAAGASVFAQFIGFTLDRLLWFVGLHGSNVVGSVMQPIWTQMATENVAAVKAGLPVPFIVSEQFLNYFVRVSMLPLILLMMNSKVKRFNILGKLALPSSIFNIAEPIMFGLPLILNPLLFIPWLFGYLLLFVLNYLLVIINVLPAAYIIVPWTTPGPIAAYLGTGGSWRAAIISVLGYVLMFFIWFPFFKALEKKTLEEEKLSDD